MIRVVPIEYGNISTNSGWGRQKNWNPTVASILLHPLSNHISDYVDSCLYLLFYKHQMDKLWQELDGVQGTECGVDSLPPVISA